MNKLNTHQIDNHLFLIAGDMNFLKQRLEEVTEHQLDVLPLLEFLQGLSFNSQATKERLATFQQKWEQHKYSKGLIIGYITGSWKPPSAARM